MNHECSIQKAKKMIKLAKRGGADAVKFQTYKAEKLASKVSPAYWSKDKEKTKSQFLLFKKFDKFGYDEYYKLYQFSKKLKIDFLSTPFDIESVNSLKKIVKFFKVASADINNYPLLKQIGKTGKPVLISTGASKINEIQKAVNILKRYGAIDISIMHCILNYPTKNQDANLGMIVDLKKIFKKQVIGYSDHTIPDKGMTSLKYAYFLGAEIFEKHFTFDKNKTGNDHYHSMDYKDVKIFKKFYKEFKIKFGISKKKPIKNELKSIKFARRSIYSFKKIFKGEKIKNHHIIAKRPGTGISPMMWNKVVGKIAKKDISEDKKIEWKYLK